MKDYGDNLVWFLEDVAHSEPEQIDGGEIEIAGETPDGRDASCTISIFELCGTAAETIKKFQAILAEQERDLAAYVGIATDKARLESEKAQLEAKAEDFEAELVFECCGESLTQFGR